MSEGPATNRRWLRLRLPTWGEFVVALVKCFVLVTIFGITGMRLVDGNPEAQMAYIVFAWGAAIAISVWGFQK